MSILVGLGFVFGILAWGIRAWRRGRTLREVWESVSAWERARAR